MNVVVHRWCCGRVLLTRQVIKNRYLFPMALEPGESKAQVLAALVSSVAWTLLDPQTLCPHSAEVKEAGPLSHRPCLES